MVRFPENLNQLLIDYFLGVMIRLEGKAKGLIMPTEEVCVACHNDESPHFKGFDFAEYVKQITHPNPTAK